MSDGRKYYCFCDANCKFETMTKEQILAAIAQAAETGLVFDADAAFITKVKEGNAGGFVSFWLGTQAQYNAIAKKDPSCFYILTDCDAPAELTQKVKNLQKQLSAHEENKNNPHGVTIAQIGAAPAGYGLGANLFRQGPHLTSLEQLNTATKTGWYSLFASPSTINNITFDCAVVEVISYIDGRTTQKLYPITNNLSNNTMLIRHSWNDALGEWDCENPPMVVGVEYRTTKRWQGATVYTKQVYFGYLPNGSTSTVGHGISGFTHLVDIGIASNKTYESIEHNSGISQIVVNTTDITVVTNTNLSGYNAYFTLEYVKS